MKKKKKDLPKPQSETAPEYQKPQLNKFKKLSKLIVGGASV